MKMSTMENGENTLCRLGIMLSLLIGANSGQEGLAQSQAIRLNPVVTEEGQKIIYDRYTWQMRELTKMIPVDQPWPDDEHMQAALVKYGLDKTSVPEHIPIPSQILPDIYLVLNDPNLTYLIDCGPEGVAIVDPGEEENFQLIISNTEKLGYSRSRIRWVLNTHAHFDHSGSDALFRKLGAQILIGEQDAAAVEKGTRVTALNFVYGPKAPAFTPTKVDWRLSDGEVLHLGNKTFDVVHTPGHTEGSVCFFLRINDQNVLFSGDTILFDNRLGENRTAYANNHVYVQSLEKLVRFHLYEADTFHWDVLLPGHGVIVLDRAYMDVEKGWHTVELDFVNGTPIKAMPWDTSAYRNLMFGRP